MSEEIEPQSADVLQFTPKCEYVWAHRCAGRAREDWGQEFFLHRDGTVQCSACKEFVNDLCWGKRGKS